MHILLIIAVASLLLGFLFWGTVRLLGARPQGQSALLVTATVALLSFPVIVFVAHQKPITIVDGMGSFPQGAMVQDLSMVDLRVADTTHLPASHVSVEKEINEQDGATPVEAATAIDPASEEAPLSVAFHLESEEAGTLTPYASPNKYPLELATASKPVEILIPLGVTKALPYLGILWLVGSLVCALRFLVQCVCLRKNTRYHRPLTDAGLEQHAQRVASDLGIGHLPKLVCSDEPSPYCYGILRRRLHLPVSLLENSTQDEVTMVLHHELQHIRQHDLALLMLQIPVRIFYWWNPLVTRLMTHLDYVRETLCDRAASENSPQRYAHLLLQFASSPTPSNQTVMAMASSAEIMKARIKNLYGPSKKDLKITGLACATIVSGMTAFLLANVQIASAHSSAVEHAVSAGDRSSVERPTSKEAITQILQANANQRTRIAAELSLPNNPVTAHYEQYQQAKRVMGILLAKGNGAKHPSVIVQKRIMDEHLKLADQSVFDLLLVLQESLGSAVIDHPQQAVIEEPTSFYPSYLKKLRSLPANAQLDYAAVLPIPNNPVILHKLEMKSLESSLHEAKAKGLGFKHPEVVGLQQRLKMYNTEYAKAALGITIGLLENKEKNPPTLIIWKLFMQRREISQLHAAGLGFKHPNISILEQHVVVLEQKIYQWNQKEQKNENTK